jgi:hypothetical protein
MHFEVREDARHEWACRVLPPRVLGFGAAVGGEVEEGGEAGGEPFCAQV